MADSEKEIIGRKKRSFKEWMICKLGGIPISQTIHQSIMRMEIARPEKIVVESAGSADNNADGKMIISDNDVFNWLKLCDGHAIFTGHGCEKCPFLEGTESGEECVERLHASALELLKSQEARLITAEDFEKAEVWANIPAWIEYNKSFGIKSIDGWVIISQGNLNDKTVRYWTHRPTDEQRKAVKWDD